jgi:hypothetical protein
VATTLACSAFIEEEDVTCDCELQGHLLSDVIDAATDLIVRLSAGRFRGRCTETVRPVFKTNWCEPSYCCDYDGIPLLGPNPVVSQVKIDGDVIDPTLYKVLDGHRLIRVSTDGTRPPMWPRLNQLWKPATEDDTFSITYTYGHAVDFTVKRATIEAACDLMRGLTAERALDGFTTSATLDGLTVSRDADVAEEAGFSWIARFLRLYGMNRGFEIASPELSGGWTLHVLS